MNKIDKLRQEIIQSETFCFYPYLELSTNPSGYIKPCCYFEDVLFIDPDGPKDYNNNTYNILRNTSLEETWNSDSMISLRKKMHKGEKVKNCATCYRDGNASMRVRSINEYKNNYKILNMVSETIENNYKSQNLPSRLELKPSNLCNLKCVMCNSYDSSQIAKELKELAVEFNGIEVYAGRFIKITPEKTGIYENNETFSNVGNPDWSDDEKIWQSFVNIAPTLENLSFAGGEPTLIPFVEKSLRYCVDNDLAKNITVFLSSNFTNLNKDFLELMPKFKKFELIASIDGFDKVNEYCRYPSKWQQISKNYLTVKEMTGRYDNVKILINITVNLLNVLDLHTLLGWIDELSMQYPYYKEWPYNINLIWGPLDQRINNLPPYLKDLAISRLQDYKNTSKVLKEFPELSMKIDLVINELSDRNRIEHEKILLDSLKNRIAVLDKHRNISIKNYIPELGALFCE